MDELVLKSELDRIYNNAFEDIKYNQITQIQPKIKIYETEELNITAAYLKSLGMEDSLIAVIIDWLKNENRVTQFNRYFTTFSILAKARPIKTIEEFIKRWSSFIADIVDKNLVIASLEPNTVLLDTLKNMDIREPMPDDFKTLSQKDMEKWFRYALEREKLEPTANTQFKVTNKDGKMTASVAKILGQNPDGITQIKFGTKVLQPTGLNNLKLRYITQVFKPYAAINKSTVTSDFLLKKKLQDEAKKEKTALLSETSKELDNEYRNTMKKLEEAQLRNPIYIEKQQKELLTDAAVKRRLDELKQTTEIADILKRFNEGKVEIMTSSMMKDLPEGSGLLKKLIKLKHNRMVGRGTLILKKN